MGTKPPTQKGQSPTQFLVHVYCGQKAAWIKIPLGTEVGIWALPPGGPCHSLTYSSGVFVSVTNYFWVGATYSGSVEMVVNSLNAYPADEGSNERRPNLWSNLRVFFVNMHVKLLSSEAFFSSKCSKCHPVAGFHPDLLTELTVLPRPPSWIKGMLVYHIRALALQSAVKCGFKNATMVLFCLDPLDELTSWTESAFQKKS